MLRLAWLGLAARGVALPFEVPHDNIARDMYCFCQSYDCNCMYRTVCQDAPQTVLAWEADTGYTCSSARYRGKCFCHKTCLCDTEKFGGMATEESAVSHTHSDGVVFPGPPPPPAPHWDEQT